MNDLEASQATPIAEGGVCGCAHRVKKRPATNAEVLPSVRENLGLV